MHFESPALSPEVFIPLLLTAAVFDDRDFALLTAVGVEWPNGNVAFTRGIQAARLLLWPQPASAVTSGVEPDAAPARNDVAPAAAVDDDTASSIDESESAAAVPDARKVEPPTTTQLFVGHVPYGLAALVVMLLVQITDCPILRYVPLPNKSRRAKGHEDPSSCILITVYFNDRDTFLQLHRRCIASPRGLYVLPQGAADFDVTERDRVIAAAHAALPLEDNRLPPGDRRLPPDNTRRALPKAPDNTRRALPKGMQPLTIEPRRRHRGQAQQARRESPQSDAATQTPVAEPQPPDEAPQSDAPDPVAPKVTRRYRNNPY